MNGQFKAAVLRGSAVALLVALLAFAGGGLGNHGNPLSLVATSLALPGLLPVFALRVDSLAVTYGVAVALCAVFYTALWVAYYKLKAWKAHDRP